MIADVEWQDRAACRATPKVVFFPVAHPGVQGFVSDSVWSHARRLCEECPVRVECLRYALLVHASDGMFGGLTPQERKRWRAKVRNDRRRMLYRSA